MMTTINRYIFRELIPPFAISAVFLTSIFIMTRIPEITNMVVNYNTGIFSVLLLIACTLPRFMEFTIPMSVMISVLLTFMRMSGDNEIIALKGGGITIYRLLPPVLIFCLLGTAVTLWITIIGVPLGNMSFKTLGIAMARSNLNVALSDGTFNSSFKDVMIYISSMDVKTKKLRDLFIEDRRTKDRVTISVAPEGVLVKDAVTGSYALRLYGGSVNQVDLKSRSINNVGFDTYDINLDFAQVQKSSKVGNKDFDEMTLNELRAFLKKTSEKPELNAALMEFHEKFSIPIACIAMGILAMALGLQAASSRKTAGFGLGMFFFLLYYLLLAAGWSAGENGLYPPLIGMWMPDIVMGGIGSFLLYRIAEERPLGLPQIFHTISGAAGRFFSRKNR
ncbi:predicted permease family protein [Desulforapulum autotrophicum HRM2]|uniref:Predicted permease family protein n=1 Tax=Desulforapulum autotrophicum (strain ATCC 43914 / DSM 3382 / VKM B-1955 / HRM2) TaxID=177437 RepID=C0QBP9_DESAH|nr:LPS export ABC transporter permease LptF [Desulforapulum autotrophicum]ACN14911.1 predicted permease family protein [Desulforapulum autotrophicum HRM2]